MSTPAQRVVGRMEEGEGPITHVIIARACGAAPEDHHAQVKVTCRGEPDANDREAARAMVADAFRWGFKEAPARIGVGVLPYVEELDGDDNGAPE